MFNFSKHIQFLETCFISRNRVWSATSGRLGEHTDTWCVGHVSACEEFRYRGTSLIRCGDSENACFFLTQTRNFLKNACLFLEELRNFSKKRLLISYTIKKFSKKRLLISQKFKNTARTQRAFAHAKAGVEPEMRYHQVMRPT